MSENTPIEWAHHSFNPWVGCEKISPACAGCYAETWAKRSGAPELWQGARRRTTTSNWYQPLKWDAKARAEGKRVRVFCASLADVFDNAVPAQWRLDLFELIGKTTNIDWLLLTKRIGNARRMLDEVMDVLSHGLQEWGEPVVWSHVWIGATVANQDEADRDIPKLLETPSAVRFLSCEPLLGPIKLSHLDVERAGHREWCQIDALTGRHTDMGRPCQDVPHLDWVIVGGESGSKARPMHPEWARALRDQCVTAAVPFFFKQVGEWCHVPGVQASYSYRPEALKYFKEHDATYAKVGKKAAGRTLDGRTWDQFPEAHTPDLCQICGGETPCHCNNPEGPL